VVWLHVGTRLHYAPPRFICTRWFTHGSPHTHTYTTVTRLRFPHTVGLHIAPRCTFGCATHFTHGYGCLGYIYHVHFVVRLYIPRFILRLGWFTHGCFVHYTPRFGYGSHGYLRLRLHYICTVPVLHTGALPYTVRLHGTFTGSPVCLRFTHVWFTTRFTRSRGYTFAHTTHTHTLFTFFTVLLVGLRRVHCVHVSLHHTVHRGLHLRLRVRFVHVSVYVFTHLPRTGSFPPHTRLPHHHTAFGTRHTVTHGFRSPHGLHAHVPGFDYAHAHCAHTGYARFGSHTHCLRLRYGSGLHTTSRAPGLRYGLVWLHFHRTHHCLLRFTGSTWFVYILHHTVHAPGYLGGSGCYYGLRTLRYHTHHTHLPGYVLVAWFTLLGLRSRTVGWLHGSLQLVLVTHGSFTTLHGSVHACVYHTTVPPHVWVHVLRSVLHTAVTGYTLRLVTHGWLLSRLHFVYGWLPVYTVPRWFGYRGSVYCLLRFGLRSVRLHTRLLHRYAVYGLHVHVRVWFCLAVHHLHGYRLRLHGWFCGSAWHGSAVRSTTAHLRFLCGLVRVPHSRGYVTLRFGYTPPRFCGCTRAVLVHGTVVHAARFVRTVHTTHLHRCLVTFTYTATHRPPALPRVWFICGYTGYGGCCLHHARFGCGWFALHGYGLVAHGYTAPRWLVGWFTHGWFTFVRLHHAPVYTVAHAVAHTHHFHYHHCGYRTVARPRCRGSHGSHVGYVRWLDSVLVTVYHTHHRVGCGLRSPHTAPRCTRFTLRYVPGCSLRLRTVYVGYVYGYTTRSHIAFYTRAHVYRCGLPVTRLRSHTRSRLRSVWLRSRSFAVCCGLPFGWVTRLRSAPHAPHCTVHWLRTHVLHTPHHTTGLVTVVVTHHTLVTHTHTRLRTRTHVHVPRTHTQFGCRFPVTRLHARYTLQFAFVCGSRLPVHVCVRILLHTLVTVPYARFAFGFTHLRFAPPAHGWFTGYYRFTVAFTPAVRYTWLLHGWFTHTRFTCYTTHHARAAAPFRLFLRCSTPRSTTFLRFVPFTVHYLHRSTHHHHHTHTTTVLVHVGYRTLHRLQVRCGYTTPHGSHGWFTFWFVALPRTHIRFPRYHTHGWVGCTVVTTSRLPRLHTLPHFTVYTLVGLLRTRLHTFTFTTRTHTTPPTHTVLPLVGFATHTTVVPSLPVTAVTTVFHSSLVTFGYRTFTLRFVCRFTVRSHRTLRVTVTRFPWFFTVPGLPHTHARTPHTRTPHGYGSGSATRLRFTYTTPRLVHTTHGYARSPRHHSPARTTPHTSHTHARLPAVTTRCSSRWLVHAHHHTRFGSHTRGCGWLRFRLQFHVRSHIHVHTGWFTTPHYTRSCWFTVLPPHTRLTVTVLVPLRLPRTRSRLFTHTPHLVHTRFTTTTGYCQFFGSHFHHTPTATAFHHTTPRFTTVPAHHTPHRTVTPTHTHHTVHGSGCTATHVPHTPPHTLRLHARLHTYARLRLLHVATWLGSPRFAHPARLVHLHTTAVTGLVYRWLVLVTVHGSHAFTRFLWLRLLLATHHVYVVTVAFHTHCTVTRLVTVLHTHYTVRLVTATVLPRLRYTAVHAVTRYWLVLRLHTCGSRSPHGLPVTVTHRTPVVWFTVYTFTPVTGYGSGSRFTCLYTAHRTGSLHIRCTFTQFGSRLRTHLHRTTGYGSPLPPGSHRTVVYHTTHGSGCGWFTVWVHWFTLRRILRGYVYGSGCSSRLPHTSSGSRFTAVLPHTCLHTHARTCRVLVRFYRHHRTVLPHVHVRTVLHYGLHARLRFVTHTTGFGWFYTRFHRLVCHTTAHTHHWLVARFYGSRVFTVTWVTPVTVHGLRFTTTRYTTTVHALRLVTSARYTWVRVTPHLPPAPLPRTLHTAHWLHHCTPRCLHTWLVTRTHGLPHVTHTVHTTPRLHHTGSPLLPTHHHCARVHLRFYAVAHHATLPRTTRTTTVTHAHVLLVGYTAVGSPHTGLRTFTTVGCCAHWVYLGWFTHVHVHTVTGWFTTHHTPHGSGFAPHTTDHSSATFGSLWFSSLHTLVTHHLRLPGSARWLVAVPCYTYTALPLTLHGLHYYGSRVTTHTFTVRLVRFGHATHVGYTTARFVTCVGWVGFTVYRFTHGLRLPHTHVLVAFTTVCAHAVALQFTHTRS